MIEITDEMLLAYERAFRRQSETPGNEVGARRRAGLAAVLAIVEQRAILLPKVIDCIPDRRATEAMLEARIVSAQIALAILRGEPAEGVGPADLDAQIRAGAARWLSDNGKKL